MPLLFACNKVVPFPGHTNLLLRVFSGPEENKPFSLCISACSKQSIEENSFTRFVHDS